MKNVILLLLLIVIISSCSDFDVIVRLSDDMVYKYKCQKGNDTANSIRYLYYKSLLLSKAPLVDGKLEGSVINYFTNGQIRIITNYKNNQANGVNIVYNEDGKVIRRSLYIDDKQVIYESIMRSEDKPIGRKKVYASIDNEVIPAGELYYNLSDSNVLGDYHGNYVDIYNYPRK